MSEFRIPLEGGQVLVLSFEIEDGEEELPASIDPTGVGQALMNALGLGPRRTTGGQVGAAVRAGRSAPRGKRIVRPVEPSADEWLAQTSADALRRLK